MWADANHFSRSFGDFFTQTTFSGLLSTFQTFYDQYVVQIDHFLSAASSTGHVVSFEKLVTNATLSILPNTSYFKGDLVLQ